MQKNERTGKSGKICCHGKKKKKKKKILQLDKTKVSLKL